MRVGKQMPIVRGFTLHIPVHCSRLGWVARDLYPTLSVPAYGPELLSKRLIS